MPSIQPGAAPSRFLAECARYLAVLENWCAEPEQQDSDPPKFRVMRAYVGALAAHLKVATEALAAGYWQLSASEAETLEELRDRADDLIDTMSWAAEGAEQLEKLAAEEACA